VTIQRRVRTIVVATSRVGLKRLLAVRLSGLVMSRTRVDGQPIHREFELLNESEASNSVEQCYLRIAPMHGTAIQITFVLYRDENGIVTSVLVETRNEPRRPPSIEPPYLNMHRMPPRIIWLKGRIRRLQEQLVRSERQIQLYQWTAGDLHSAQHERHPNTGEVQTNRLIERYANLVGGPPNASDRIAARNVDVEGLELAEEYIAREERIIEGINRQIEDLNTELHELEESHNRFSQRSRCPGPQGSGTAY
jgi:hypothetical protein